MLMDYQVGICTDKGPAGATPLSEQVTERGVLERVPGCLRAAREAGLPVIHIRLAFDEGYQLRINRTNRFARFENNGSMKLGSEEADFCAESRPVAGEIVVTKTCINPFIGTQLMEVLLIRGINTLFLGGVATNFVVESAVRHAADSGFSVNVLADLCASQNERMHQFAMENTLPAFGRIITSAEFINMLGDG
jgi:nicotinamidase-related amidase